MRHAIFAVLAAISPASAQMAVVHDPVTHAAVQAQTTMSNLHNQFMQMQIVKDAVILKNTYLESKAYYDKIDEHSKHQGGLMGYYKDYFEGQANNMAAQEWRRLNFEANTITGATPIDKMVGGVADSINAKVDQAAGAIISGAKAPVNSLDAGYGGVRLALFSRLKAETEAADKLTAASEQRGDETAKQVQQLVHMCSDPLGISQKTRESCALQASLLQLQQQSELRQLLNVNNQLQNSVRKQHLAEMSVAQAASLDMARYGSRPGNARISDDAGKQKVWQELKRNPGE